MFPWCFSLASNFLHDLCLVLFQNSIFLHDLFPWCFSQAAVDSATAGGAAAVGSVLRISSSRREQLPTLRAGVALVLYLTLDAQPKKRLPTLRAGVALNLFLMLSFKKGAATYPVGTLWEDCGNPVGTLS